MPIFENLPDPFEKQRIPDELAAEAYETVPDTERAKLKASQAMVMAVYHEQRLPEKIVTSFAASGYRVCRTHTSAPWVLVFAGANTNPARLASSLTAARLAGSDEIAVVFLEEPKSPAVLVALDLCGIEHSFAMKFDLAADFIDYAAQCGRDNIENEATPIHGTGLSAGKGRGRVLLFDAPPGLAGTAFGLGIAFCNDQSARPAVMVGESLDGCYVDSNLSPDFFIDTDIEFSEIEQD